MFRIIRWLFLIAIIGGIVLWITGYKIGGKTIQEHLKPVLDKPIVKEGIHDVRQIVGEGLKAAGEAISEDVTDSERRQLDKLVKDELMQGKPIEGVPGQQALPPQAAPPAPAPLQQPRPTAEQMLQQVQQAVVPGVPVAAVPVPQQPQAPAPVQQPPAPVQQPAIPPSGGEGY